MIAGEHMREAKNLSWLVVNALNAWLLFLPWIGKNESQQNARAVFCFFGTRIKNWLQMFFGEWRKSLVRRSRSV